MTEIAYHPTHVRALRETFKALRTAEFPWTADTIYLNNASIGPIPERTRRALDEFTAKRTAPHLLPDRELFAGLAAARLGIAQLINCDPSEVALATNTGYGLNLAARALPLKPGDVVLLSDKEFPANVYPWLLLRDQGIKVEMARCRPEGWPDEEYLLQRRRGARDSCTCAKSSWLSSSPRSRVGWHSKGPTTSRGSPSTTRRFAPTPAASR